MGNGLKENYWIGILIVKIKIKYIEFQIKRELLYIDKVIQIN